ncbi:leucyl/phenylalanyl-tRNA--protein transferase [Balneola sp. MJW-20]|uniref:leucyl/phenylalanyl-tRNA--protein transferase n=1 Tax=Gracilimonas aurantiaca TaxID=3234185 RepID=UPI003466BBC2
MQVIEPEALLKAYSQGIFPMANSKESKNVDWYTACKRGIIPLDNFHMSSNVMRLIRRGDFEVNIDTNFRQVIIACADRETTWINPLIIDSYCVLNEMGYAHSVEIYTGNELTGGLYGVSLGGAFFGESMFHYEPETDKIALYYCHEILEKNGFELWDTQFYTDHLARFGCIEIDSEEYEIRLEKALQKRCSFRMIK